MTLLATLMVTATAVGFFCSPAGAQTIISDRRGPPLFITTSYHRIPLDPRYMPDRQVDLLYTEAEEELPREITLTIMSLLMVAIAAMVAISQTKSSEKRGLAMVSIAFVVFFLVFLSMPKPPEQERFFLTVYKPLMIKHWTETVLAVANDHLNEDWTFPPESSGVGSGYASYSAEYPDGGYHGSPGSFASYKIDRNAIVLTENILIPSAVSPTPPR